MPSLTRPYEVKRANSVKEKVTCDHVKFAEVVFYDEKQFNLVAPDGIQCDWKEEQIFSETI